MNYNEKVISILNSRELTEEQKTKLEEIFPDLRDSKDDRIRKVLLSHFSRYQKEEVFLNNITMGDIAAWLEKQGEHANFRNKIQIGDKVTRNEDGVLVNLSQLKRVAKNDEKQGEQERIHKHKIGDTVYYNSFGEVKSMIVANIVTDSTDNPMYEDENGNAVFEKDLIEQKSADKKGMNLVEEEMTPFQKEVFCIIDTTIEEEQGLKQVCDKLFSLASNEIKQKHAETEKGAKGNDREIPNSAWSKDDEYYYGIIQYCLNNEIVGKADKENAISWFQSLKERYTWKPSDLPHWKKSTLPNDNTTGFNSDYFCHKGYCINYKELFEKLPKDD